MATRQKYVDNCCFRVYFVLTLNLKTVITQFHNSYAHIVRFCSLYFFIFLISMFSSLSKKFVTTVWAMTKSQTMCGLWLKINLIVGQNVHLKVWFILSLVFISIQMLFRGKFGYCSLVFLCHRENFKIHSKFSFQLYHKRTCIWNNKKSHKCVCVWIFLSCPCPISLSLR